MILHGKAPVESDPVDLQVEVLAQVGPGPVGHQDRTSAAAAARSSGWQERSLLGGGPGVVIVGVAGRGCGCPPGPVRGGWLGPGSPVRQVSVVVHGTWPCWSCWSRPRPCPVSSLVGQQCRWCWFTMINSVAAAVSSPAFSPSIYWLVSVKLSVILFSTQCKGSATILDMYVCMFICEVR